MGALLRLDKETVPKDFLLSYVFRECGGTLDKES